MASLGGREGLLSRRLAAGSNRMERLLGLSSHYSFASAGENPEELREEDVWLAGCGDEDFGEEKKNAVYFHLNEDFMGERKKTRNSFLLRDDFGDDKTTATRNYFHSREDLGDEKTTTTTKNYFHLPEDLADEKKMMMNYFHFLEDLGDETMKMKNYLYLQEESTDENKKMKKYFHSGKNSANIVKLSDGLGISGLSVAFEDPALRSRDVSFVMSSSRVITRVETPDAEKKGIIYQSAPVNVPDWTKILGIQHRHAENRNIFTADEDEMDDFDERLPPHEYLAREQSRSHLDATSVLEGVGRKLKGRDMSRVRNAVWNQTGFLG